MDNLNKLIDAVGTLAESMTIFYKACLDSGADAETAYNLTGIYMREMLGSSARFLEEGEE